MKVNISLVFLGAVAASAIALPAQAATVFTTTTKNASITSPPESFSPAAAYRIEGVSIAGSSTLYNVDFNHGTFESSSVTDPNDSSVYNDILPTLPPAISLTETAAQRANRIGSGILSALQTAGIGHVIERTSSTTFGRDIVREFFIPFAQRTDPGQLSDNLVAFCTIPLPPQAPNPCDTTTQFKNKNANIMYATFTAANSGPNIPTPALIPGLLGMGLAAMRKKQQAAAVDA
jgi:hypothetical protein